MVLYLGLERVVNGCGMLLILALQPVAKHRIRQQSLCNRRAGLAQVRHEVVVGNRDPVQRSHPWREHVVQMCAEPLDCRVAGIKDVQGTQRRRKVSALGAHIGGLKEEVARQLTLYGEIPLRGNFFLQASYVGTKEEVARQWNLTVERQLLRIRPPVAVQWPILDG